MHRGSSLSQAAMLGAAGKEAAQGRVKLGLVEQECVMAFVGRDLDEADIGGGSVERVHDLAILRGRIEPVARKGDGAEPRLRAAEGVGEHAAMLGGEIEIIASARDVEIGIGVEPLDEADALMAQIVLDLEIGVEAEA